MILPCQVSIRGSCRPRQSVVSRRFRNAARQGQDGPQDPKRLEASRGIAPPPARLMQTEAPRPASRPPTGDRRSEHSATTAAEPLGDVKLPTEPPRPSPARSGPPTLRPRSQRTSPKPLAPPIATHDLGSQAGEPAFAARTPHRSTFWSGSGTTTPNWSRQHESPRPLTWGFTAGAGDENRTRALSLGSSCSTIKLRPPDEPSETAQSSVTVPHSRLWLHGPPGEWRGGRGWVGGVLCGPRTSAPAGGFGAASHGVECPEHPLM